MSKHYGDFAAGQTVRIEFNTAAPTTGAPVTLTSGSLQVVKDGSNVTPSGGVTLTTDAGSVTGRHTVVITTATDATTFSAGSEYSIRLAGSSAVAGVSVLGRLVGSFSIANRAVAPITGTRAGYLDNLATAPATAGAAMTLTSGERDAMAAALLDLADGIESGETPRQTLRLIRAVLAGVATETSGTYVLKRKDGTTTAVTVVHDATGNRTSSTVGTL